LRIVFMGTPEFAETALRKVVESGFNVVGVVTMPDKPMGRHGSVLQSSPVKKYAQSVNIPVLQPEKLKSPEFLQELEDLKADIQIVVAFRMLPEQVWNMPPMGTFNLHASLLPQYRGAAPINWAVINGEKETGVTTFFLKHEIDTGDIIRQEKIAIADSDNVEIVHDKLMYLGADLIVETLNDIVAGNVTRKAQLDYYVDESELKPAPKIFKDTCRIDWNKSSKQVYDFIRGLSPYPAAWTEMVMPDGTKCDLKIFGAEIVGGNVPALTPGTIDTDCKSYIEISTADGALRITDLQASGRKRMQTKSFLCGNDVSACFCCSYNSAAQE
jgi:methionyl-tRNA formyltransferase